MLGNISTSMSVRRTCKWKPERKIIVIYIDRRKKLSCRHTTNCCVNIISLVPPSIWPTLKFIFTNKSSFIDNVTRSIEFWRYFKLVRITIHKHFLFMKPKSIANYIEYDNNMIYNVFKCKKLGNKMYILFIIMTKIWNNIFLKTSIVFYR